MCSEGIKIFLYDLEDLTFVLNKDTKFFLFVCFFLDSTGNCKFVLYHRSTLKVTAGATCWSLSLCVMNQCCNHPARSFLRKPVCCEQQRSETHLAPVVLFLSLILNCGRTALHIKVFLLLPHTCTELKCLKKKKSCEMFYSHLLLR